MELFYIFTEVRINWYIEPKYRKEFSIKIIPKGKRKKKTWADSGGCDFSLTGNIQEQKGIPLCTQQIFSACL